jgi:hypothetical protein
MEPKMVLPGTKKGFTWNQQGFLWGQAKSVLRLFTLRLSVLVCVCFTLPPLLAHQLYLRVVLSIQTGRGGSVH